MRLCFFLLLFTPALVRAQQPVPAIDSLYFRYVIQALADDSMEGRLPGTEGERKSAQFIENELMNIGCQPLHPKQFTIPFTFVNTAHTLVQSTGDVIGIVDSPSEYSVVITAHYDHIGHGEFHSNDPFSHSVHNGADDNASGIAMLLALAKWCSIHADSLKQDFIFAAVSGEEDGLFGSQLLLTGGIPDTTHIICNINFDMIGHLDKLRPQLFTEGARECDAWKKILPSDTTPYFIVNHRAVRFSDGSDHCTFLNANIPALMFTTGTSSTYHRPDDDPQYVNYRGMVNVGHYLETVLLQLNRSDLQAVFRRQRP